MKKHIVLFSVVAAALVFAPAVVCADDTNAPASTETKPKHNNSDATPYQGKLAAVSSSSITVTTKTAGDLKLNITADTKILKNGEKAAITDFAVGDRVSGSYKKDASGNLNAYSLHEGKKPGGPKKKKADQQ